ncbi:MAG: NAD-dependent epimerase/dehydratase family protein [Paracoccaceae bacterium]
MLGATGRIGRLLAGAWPQGTGVAPVWMGRRAAWPVEAGGVADMLDPEALGPALRGCDVALCLTGAPAGPAGTHAAAIRALLDAAPGAGLGGVLAMSSAAVHGGGGRLIPDDAPPAPATDYGRAKAAVEGVCAEHAAGAGPPPVCALRLANVAGADALLGAGAGALHVFEGRAARRSYVGPQTLARILGALARRLAGGDGLPPVLNVAGRQGTDVRALALAAGLSLPKVPAPAHVPEHATVSTDLLWSLIDVPGAEDGPDEMVRQWRAAAARAPR